MRNRCILNVIIIVRTAKVGLIPWIHIARLSLKESLIRKCARLLVISGNMMEHTLLSKRWSSWCCSCCGWLFCSNIRIFLMVRPLFLMMMLSSFFMMCFLSTTIIMSMMVSLERNSLRFFKSDSSDQKENWNRWFHFIIIKINIII